MPGENGRVGYYERDVIHKQADLEVTVYHRYNSDMRMGLMHSAKGSMRRVKIIGQRGHPCLVPLVIWMVLDIIPEVRTTIEREEYPVASQ